MTDIEFKTADGIFIKQIVMPKAKTIHPQHVHLWDHSTLLVRGSVVLWKDGQPSYHKAPEILFIPKGSIHEFQTLEDDCLLYCIHNLHGKEATEILHQHDLDPDDLRLGEL